MALIRLLPDIFAFYIHVSCFFNLETTNTDTEP